MTSSTNLDKRLWEETPAGKMEVKIKKLHNKLYDTDKLTHDIQRWVDIHRAQTMSAERDLTDEFIEKGKALEEEYRTKWTDFMCGQYQKEIDYLTQYV